MSTRAMILERVRTQLPIGSELSSQVREETALADLGLTSLHLITVLLQLQREEGIEVDQLIETGMPRTIGDLVTLVERTQNPETRM